MHTVVPCPLEAIQLNTIQRKVYAVRRHSGSPQTCEQPRLAALGQEAK